MEKEASVARPALSIFAQGQPQDHSRKKLQRLSHT